MNKQKLDKIRKNIRHYTPEIIAASSVIAGAAAAFWLVKDAKNNALALGATEDQLHMMKETDNGMLFQTEIGNFFLKEVDW